MKRYLKGAVVELIASCSVGGVLTDPGQVLLKVLDPNGAEAVYTNLVHDSVGVFRYEYQAGVAGTYTVRFEMTGTIQDAQEQQFAVAPDLF